VNISALKHEQKRPFVRPRSRWEDITMHLKEIGRRVAEWIHLAQDRDQ